jgi:inward rectifier potassium channel
MTRNAAPAARIRLRPSSDALPQVKAEGAHAAPWEDMFHTVLIMPWWQFFVAIGGVFVLLNLAFALLYWAAPGCIGNVPEDANRFEYLFYFSVQTMATIGYGGMLPVTRYGHILVVIESIAGTLTTAIITGLTFAKFARPTARVLFAKRLVVSTRDGVPTLMIRMANWRRNQVVEARAKVMLLRTQVTREGDVMRIPVELPLVRESTQLFWLTWTAMHTIDEKSPFYGPNAMEVLKKEDAQIFLSFQGLDATMGQTIHASTRYALDDIIWNSRYKDVLTTKGEVRVINYRHFHEVEPEPMGPPSRREG